MAKADTKLSSNTDLLRFWDFEKNVIKPDDIALASGKLVWWKCLKDASHSWQKSPHKTIGGRKNNPKLPSCPICALWERSLAANKPEVITFWDKEKNSPRTPENTAPGSKVIVWFICKTTSEHKWSQLLSNIGDSSIRCPICFRDFKDKYPNLAKEWDFTKNDKNPEDFSYGSGYKAWWKCIRNHEFRTRIVDRTIYGHGCLLCPKEDNSLGLLLPEMLKEWDYEKNTLDPFKITAHGNDRVHWKCERGHQWDTKVCDRTNKRRTKCPYCKLTTSSVPELYVLFELSQFFKISKEPQRIKTKLKTYGVDIVIPELKVIVEYDGAWWHRNTKPDNIKNYALEELGWKVIRIRCDPLPEIRDWDIIRTKEMSLKDSIYQVLLSLKTEFKLDIAISNYLETQEFKTKAEVEVHISELLKKQPLTNMRLVGFSKRRDGL